MLLKNKKAKFNYEFLDTLEVGIVLTGSEVKSIKTASVNMTDSFIRIINGELILSNMHISQPNVQNIFFTHEPLRDRKLLAHKKQIQKLEKQLATKGLTIVPTKIYTKNNLIKMEIALARGKHTYDKRQSIKNKDIKRDIERQMKGQI